jgi:YYY domain-containing protein
LAEAVVWWLTLQVLGLVAIPVSAVLLRALPDRGYSASKVLGLLLVGWLAYTLSMLQIVPFERWLIALCVIAVAAFSGWLLFRKDRALLQELRGHFGKRSTIKYIVTAEVLFGLLYAIWTIFRAYNPNIVDQEKFMDFGFLNAILKTGTFPPNDMWLAGHSINYYYFGYVLMAALTSLSGVPTEIAFNLANSALFALTALGAFGVAYNLIAASLLRRPAAVRAERVVAATAIVPRKRARSANGSAGPPPEPTREAIPARRVRSQRAGGATAQIASATAVVDKEPPLRSSKRGDGHAHQEIVPPVESAEPVVPYLPAEDVEDEPRRVPFYLSPYPYAVLAALMVVAMGNLTTLFAVQNGDRMEGHGWRFCFNCQTAANFRWWDPSRIIQDYRVVQLPGQPAKKETVGYDNISEFPAFSFVLADMHPHVMALPLVLLAIAAALALSRRKVLRGSRWRDGVPPGFHSWLTLILVGLIVGSLYTTNTWDFPTYLVIVLAGLGLPYLAVQRHAEQSRGWAWLRPWIVQSALIILLAIVTFLPFHLTFKSLVGGEPVQLPANLANIPIVSWVLEKLATLLLVNTADKTILGFLVIFGIFLVALLVWLAYEAVGLARRRSASGANGNATLYIFLGVIAVALLLALLFKFPLLALLLPMAVVCLNIVWREPERTERNLALVMVGVAALIGLVIEVVFLRDNFQMRMNTIFKFYFQIWVLWALAAGYGLWRTLHAAMREREGHDERGRVTLTTAPAGIRAMAGIWAVFFLLLAFSGLLYGYYGPMSRQVAGGGQRLRGLDGTTWLRDASPGDHAGIVWLKANAGGNDTVLEAGRDEYGRPGRVSAYTGVPTLAAWDTSHEALWRTGQPELRAELGKRRQVVNSIYKGVDPTNGAPITAQRLLELLKQYGVTYVFVGATERGEAGAAPADPTEQVTPYAEAVFRQAMPVAFSSGSTLIYAVKEGVAGAGEAPPTPIAGTTPPPARQFDPNAPPAGLFDHVPAGPNRGQFNFPRGITSDAEGNFYVVDTHNLRIQKFDRDGKFVTMFGSKGNSDGQFLPFSDEAEGTGPGGIAVDAAGNLYVADTWNHRVQKFDRDGKFLAQWGSFINMADASATADLDANRKFFGPRGVAIGPDGDVYVTDTGNKRVLIFGPDGSYKRQISSGMSPTRFAPDYPFNQPGELNEPIGIAVDNAGTVYVADTNNGRIQKFDATGKYVANWAVQAGGWAPGPYLEPFLALDGAGNVYATAPTSKSVLKYSPTGELLGQKGPEAASLSLPTGLLVGGDGTIYVVDTGGHAVVNAGSIP